MFPHKEPDAAGRYLMDCINPGRPEKLDPEQVIALLKLGHDTGCHVVMHFVAQSASYSTPEPIEPEDEKAELQRDFIRTVEQQKRILHRFERLTT